MATGVLMDLLKRHTPSGRLPVSLADDLLHGCPMFFPYHQQQYLSAFQQLEGVNKPGVSACAPTSPWPNPGRPESPACVPFDPLHEALLSPDPCSHEAAFSCLAVPRGVVQRQLSRCFLCMRGAHVVHVGHTCGGRRRVHGCRAQKEEIATEFMGKMTASLAEAVVLRDIIPLLLPLGKYQAIVALSIAKADAQARSPLHYVVGDANTHASPPTSAGPCLSMQHPQRAAQSPTWSQQRMCCRVLRVDPRRLRSAHACPVPVRRLPDPFPLNPSQEHACTPCGDCGPPLIRSC